MKLRRVLLILASCAVLCDATTTYGFIQQGYREGNPPVRWLLATVGVLLGLALLSALRIGALVLIERSGARWPRVSTTILAFALFSGAFAVAWNMSTP